MSVEISNFPFFSPQIVQITKTSAGNTWEKLEYTIDPGVIVEIEALEVENEDSKWGYVTCYIEEVAPRSIALINGIMHPYPTKGAGAKWFGKIILKGPVKIVAEFKDTSSGDVLNLKIWTVRLG